MAIERYRRKGSRPLIYWAVEREKIRKLKESGAPPPWTADPILQKYRFCNLRRSDDRVSRWLIGNVLSMPNIGWSEWSFLQFVGLCRWVNWPPTLAAMRDAKLWPRRKLPLRDMGQFIDELKAQDTVKVWTGAYMVRAPKQSMHLPPTGKGAFICEEVVGGLEEIRKALPIAVKSGYLENVYNALQQVNYWGNFMAGQVATDISYSPVLMPLDAVRWAPVGPGSRRGHNRLLGLPLKQRISDLEQWSEQLQIWRGEIIAALGPGYDNLMLMDVQNALCETDKMLRAKYGEGRPRSTYAPEEAY